MPPIPHTAPCRTPGEVLRSASLELARLHRIRGASHRTWRRIARAKARLAFAAALLAGSASEPALAAAPRFHVGFRFHESLFYFAYYPDPTFADLDDDGDPDLIVGDQFGSTIFVENSGTPTEPVLGPAALAPFGLGEVGGWASPAFADIDGDGDLDAFVGNNDGHTVFRQNTGTASAPAFGPAQTDPFGLEDVGTGSSPTFADIDGDGDADAFVGNHAGETIFFENSGTAGTPAFTEPATNPFGLADVGFDATPAFTDLDGDGDLDALVASSFFENTGTANAPAFAAPLSHPFGLSGGGFYLNDSWAFADVDGDGDLDAVIGFYAGDFFGDLQAFENTGGATAPAFAHVPPSAADLGGFVVGVVPRDASPTLGDLDGDGDLDALVGRRDGSIALFENTGSAGQPAFGLFPQTTETFGLANVGGFAVPHLADVDGDGDLDALIGTNAGNTVFFANTGTATLPAFAAPATNPFGLADVGFYAAPVLADIDGDGDLDAFVGGGIGVTRFFANTGSASAPAFDPASTNSFGLADVGLRAKPAFGDVDGDGDLDAIIGAASGNSLVFANTGTATAPAFAAMATNPFGLADVGASASPALADIDSDGDLDAFVGTSTDRVFFFENVSTDSEACTDGLDNDGDGRIDLGSDAGCANAADTSELSALQCDNGIDDDADGKIDWRGDGSGDPHCSGLLDDRELPPPAGPGCGIGPELLLLAPLFAAGQTARGRRRA